MVMVPPGWMSSRGTVVGAAVTFVIPPAMLVFTPCLVEVAVVFLTTDVVFLAVVADTEPAVDDVVATALVSWVGAAVDSVTADVLVVVSSAAVLGFLEPPPPHAAATNPTATTTAAAPPRLRWRRPSTDERIEPTGALI